MNGKDFNALMKEEIKSFGGEKPKLLLHACCAPCSSAVLERLVLFFKITVFFFNPNITDGDEYELRFSELKRFVSERYGEKVEVAGGRYRPEEFFEAAKGFGKEPEGGKRCEICFALRLYKSAEYAAKNGFGLFCTTLTVSPHKNAETINRIGEKAGEKNGVKFLPSDFKKENGFVRSTVLSKEYGLYRQDYCGCIFSKRQETDRKIADNSGKTQKQSS